MRQLRENAIFSVAIMSLRLLLRSLVYFLDVSSANIIHFYQAGVKGQGFRILLINLRQITLIFKATVKFPCKLIREIESWKILRLLFNEDMMSILM